MPAIEQKLQDARTKPLVQQPEVGLVPIPVQAMVAAGEAFGTVALLQHRRKRRLLLARKDLADHFQNNRLGCGSKLVVAAESLGLRP